MMPKILSKIEFAGIKYMLDQGMKISDIANVCGYCNRTIYRVRECADYDTYDSLRDSLNAKRAEYRRENAIAQNNQHESLNRDMLKVIFEGIKLIATKQDTIICKLSELIEKWE